MALLVITWYVYVIITHSIMMLSTLLCHIKYALLLHYKDGRIQYRHFLYIE